jgi:hypothetical protein
MKATGSPRTWPTSCFINGGCGAQVFAHTNGHGDFVLFDELCWPWPVHGCYASRYCDEDDRIPGLAPTAYLEYRNTNVAPPPDRHKPRDIVRVDAKRGTSIEILGSVQDYVENAARKRLAKVGGIGRQQVVRLLGNRTSQITILTQERESFSAFADLRDTVISRGMTVAARLRGLMLIPGDVVFVVEDMKLFRRPTRKNS